MSNSFIWTIDRTLSGTTTPGLSGPVSDGNEVVLYSITGASPPDLIASYPEYSLGESYSLIVKNISI